MTYDGTSDEAAAPWHYLIRFLRGATLVSIVVVQAIFLFISVAAFYRIEALIAIFKVARITVPEVALLLVSSLSPLINSGSYRQACQAVEERYGQRLRLNGRSE